MLAPEYPLDIIQFLELQRKIFPIVLLRKCYAKLSQLLSKTIYDT